MGAAAALVCSADPKGAFEFLVAELDTPSPHGVLRGRLVGELAKRNDARVTPLLISIATDPRELDAPRVAAVAGLGRIGRGDLTVRRELLSLLATESWRVRRETITALGALRDPAVYGPLAEYYRASVHPIERRAIEAVFAAAVEG
jgi:HEAT repeat protein